MNRYASLSDDFYLNMHLQTQLELPQQRETLLHFFELVQKRYPDLRTSTIANATSLYWKRTRTPVAIVGLGSSRNGYARELSIPHRSRKLSNSIRRSRHCTPCALGLSIGLRIVECHVRIRLHLSRQS